MDHFIDSIDIQNFKSIRQLHIAGLNRINLLIGRPNVGKSNILEALGLFSVPYLFDGSKRLTDLLRVENATELFHDGNVKEELHIVLSRIKNINQERCVINFSNQSDTQTINFDYFNFITEIWNHFWCAFDKNFKIVDNSSLGDIISKKDIKTYSFGYSYSMEVRRSYLIPPYGKNIFGVLELEPELRKIYDSWFRQYGLRLVLDKTDSSLKALKDKGDSIFVLPYSSIADTLQRIIFYKTAIRSNENSVLIFEEPEAHAYPPYISEFTQEVIQSKTNQFFIATHSPFVVDDFLLNAIEELSILMVDFKDGQTAVRSLTQEELQEVRTYGIDLFFNSKRYPV